MKRDVSTRRKDDVFWRDSAICRLCNDELQELRWHCDHIVPLWNGGDNSMENLQSLCANCHCEKTILEARDRARIRREKARELEAVEIAARAEAFLGTTLEEFRYDRHTSRCR